MRNNSVLVAFVALAACHGFDAQPPEGFAAFDDWSQFRAVSADGIMYRVRAEDNDPEATLDFWKEALRKRMTNAGYAFVAEQEVKAGSPGYLLELAAPVGEQDYSYLVAIFVRGSDIIIAEATGEVSRFAARRDAVVTAMAQIK